MRALARPLVLSWSLLLAGALAPGTAQAQTDPNQQYQAQPGYQQPQGYPDQPGYQQPQQYPQPGYQQPQQGYPQQQYPQQNYQQQYPQQGYAPQAPPPQPRYYAPQPAYTQPSGAAPDRVGVLFIPYLGAYIPVGRASDGLSPGLRIGGILGFNLPPFLSLNGELTFDLANPNGASSNYTEVMYDLAFSPLFHLRIPQLEFVVGPKFGYYGYYISDSWGGSSNDLESGYAYGLNAGVFVPLGRMAIGGLFSLIGRHVSSSCGNYGYCGSVADGPDYKFLGFSGALLY